jgi:hypothetical protein
VWQPLKHLFYNALQKVYGREVMDSKYRVLLLKTLEALMKYGIAVFWEAFKSLPGLYKTASRVWWWWPFPRDVACSLIKRF